MIARARLMAAASVPPPPPDAPSPPELAHAFWADASGDWEGVSATLPDTARLGLTSAVSTGRLRVQLWVYQPVTNAPPGVSLRDAASLLPPAVARLLLSAGFHVALLADIVRLLALRASAEPGWFVDADTLWLRPAADVLPHLPAEACGHFFGSAARQPGKRGATCADFERECTFLYLARPRDGLLFAPPLSVAACKSPDSFRPAETRGVLPSPRGQAGATLRG